MRPKGQEGGSLDELGHGTEDVQGQVWAKALRQTQLTQQVRRTEPGM